MSTETETSHKTKRGLAKRYNADGSIALIGDGRVVFKSKDPRDIEFFAKGWYGASPIIWNRAQFSRRRQITGRSALRVQPEQTTNPQREF